MSVVGGMWRALAGFSYLNHSSGIGHYIFSILAWYVWSVRTSNIVYEHCGRLGGVALHIGTLGSGLSCMKFYYRESFYGHSVHMQLLAE